MKYVSFDVLATKPKTKVYGVFSKEDGEYLATIYWLAGWRQYVFESNKNIVWSRSCLQQVKDFIQELMDKRKKGGTEGST